MSEKRTILLADPDAHAARRIAAGLRARGHTVLTVRDGSRALEVAVMRAPDVVLYDVGCPLIDPRTFCQILHANPRTARIPVIIVGPDETHERMRGGVREAFLLKPFNVDEVLTRIRQIFRRVEAAEEVEEEGALEGSLAQIALPDLLQIMAMNRRSGTLRVRGEVAGRRRVLSGEMLLREGRIIDATADEVGGEKALYRLLTIGSGKFSFVPGMPHGPGRIQKPMDALLLEAMRQKDELRSLEGKAPRRGDVLALAVDPASLPDGLHPVTQEVLGLVDLFHTAGEVVDHAQAPDLEVMRALTTLIDRGLVRVAGRTAIEPEGRLLVRPEVAYALKAKQQARGSGTQLVSLRVVVAAPEPASLRALLSDLSDVQGWRATPTRQTFELGLGDLGLVALADAVEVVLTSLPVDDSLSPLWRPFGGQHIGGLVLGEEAGDERLEALFEWLAARRRPLAFVGSHPRLEARIAGDPVRGATPSEALSRLLRRIARMP